MVPRGIRPWRSARHAWCWVVLFLLLCGSFSAGFRPFHRAGGFLLAHYRPLFPAMFLAALGSFACHRSVCSS